VKNIYHGEPATPVITKEFRSVRTAIRRGAKSDVEFAGGERILLRVFDNSGSRSAGMLLPLADSCR